MSEQLSKGDKFLKNCGTASVGEYNKEIYYYQRSWKRNLPTVKNLKANVSSVSPSLQPFAVTKG